MCEINNEKILRDITDDKRESFTEACWPLVNIVLILRNTFLKHKLSPYIRHGLSVMEYECQCACQCEHLKVSQTERWYAGNWIGLRMFLSFSHISSWQLRQQCQLKMCEKCYNSFRALFRRHFFASPFNLIKPPIISTEDSLDSSLSWTVFLCDLRADHQSLHA